MTVMGRATDGGTDEGKQAKFGHKLTLWSGGFAAMSIGEQTTAVGQHQFFIFETISRSFGILLISKLYGSVRDNIYSKFTK